MSTPIVASRPESALYRRVWRWHFYAGLICMPFLALMALTGALYLYKDTIEAAVYRPLWFAGPATRPILDAESLVGAALASRPGEPVRFSPPSQPGRSVEVGVRTAQGTVGVYLDPATGQVLGEIADDWRLMEVVKRVHSLAIAGTVANHWVEIVAGWAIVLVLTGIFLWWPRSRRGGVCSVRGRPAHRMWWRDVHAVTGATAAAAILFLAVTGMPWSAFWGQQFGRITSELGIGLPRYLFGPGPASAPPLTAVGTSLPWMISQAPQPQSSVAHGAGIGLNTALEIFGGLGLGAATPVSLPQGLHGTYAAMQFPEDVRMQRVVHLDRYTGAVLSDVGYRDYGVAGRAIEWGINIHTGMQFGWLNRLVMLAACLSIIVLSASAAVMWWKRRPAGRLAAPGRHEADRAAAGALAVAVALGIVFPLLGASMLVALLVDVLVPARWHERFGL